MLGVDMQRLVYRAEQALLLDRLGQEVHRAALERGHGLLDVAVARKKDDRVDATLTVQLRLYLEAVLARHGDVEQDAARHFAMYGKERGSGVELTGAVSRGAQQSTQGCTDVLVVIEDKDNGVQLLQHPFPRSLFARHVDHAKT